LKVLAISIDIGKKKLVEQPKMSGVLTIKPMEMA
jgi:hypothetical protein